MEINEYKDMYLAESREYLQSLNDSLLKLEWEAENSELIQGMFRSAHSLKGMSATMGYENVTELTHELENLLQLLREGTITLTSELADLLFSALDVLDNILSQIENPELPDVSILPMIEKFNKFQHNFLQASEICSDVEAEAFKTGAPGNLFTLEEFEKVIINEGLQQGFNSCTITVKLMEDCMLSSVRAYMVIKALEENGTILQAKPSLSEIEEDQFDNLFSLLYQSKESLETIREIAEKVSEIESVQVSHFSLDDYLDDVKEAVPDTQSKPGHETGNQKTTPALSPEKTVRVDTNKLDKLMNLVGELIINRTRVVELGKEAQHKEIINATEQLSLITTELQNAVMKLRMVPIKQVFDRFPRMVRDISKERGKSIRLEILGEDTELDRSIVNQIGEPLVHLLRNAVDHGIECSSDRAAAGKEQEGCIRLEARHEGNYIAIEVTDNGVGLDAKKLINKALDKKIINADEADRMKDEEAFELIFANGFSTAEAITDISGRGVGMDAVKKIVESLNGLIQIRSIINHGTTITLRLPLTLAILKAMMVQAGKEIYAIPIENIEENILLYREDIRYVQGESVISLRNEVIPVAALDHCLYGQKQVELLEEIPTVIVSTGEKKVGLMVNDLLGQQEVVIKPLGSLLGTPKGIAGATILGNGNVAMILNIATLI